MSESKIKKTIARRFRGFLPIVVDIETAGLTPKTDAVLEIAAVILQMDDNKQISPADTVSCHVKPFEGANIDRKALEFTGIIPDHPFRFAIDEKEAVETIFSRIEEELEITGCSRAVLVGHNAWFDLHFLQAMVKRTKSKDVFHRFTTFDTATLGGIFCGQTVLARACKKMKIPFDPNEAHSAIYDAERTAELFCKITNKATACF
jgi:ribonuclease T